MQPSSSIAAIILAAGSSSRMSENRHKLLLPLGERPVLAHVLAETLASQATPVIVVLGHQADEVRAVLAEYSPHPRVRIIENPNYHQGMSTSIHVAIHALMGDEYAPRPVGGVLIVLGDQPLVAASSMDTLIEYKSHTSQRIVVPLYEGQRGNPVLFDASLFSELLTVGGDEGGRSVLQRHRTEVATIELGSAIASLDVDTWDAYQQVVSQWQQLHNKKNDRQM